MCQLPKPRNDKNKKDDTCIDEKCNFCSLEGRFKNLHKNITDKQNRHRPHQKMADIILNSKTRIGNDMPNKYSQKTQNTQNDIHAIVTCPELLQTLYHAHF